MSGRGLTALEYARSNPGDGENSERAECSTVLRSDLSGEIPPVLQPYVPFFNGFRYWESWFGRSTPHLKNPI